MFIVKFAVMYKFELAYEVWYIQFGWPAPDAEDDPSMS
jgi:hypothetical protein